MNIKMYFRMLQKGWWIILLAFLTTINMTLIMDYFAPPVYEAKTRMLVVPNPESFTGQGFISSLNSLDGSSIVTTYADVFDSEFIRQAFVDSLKLTEAQKKEYTQKTVVLPNSNVLELYVTGPDADIAVQWANGVARSGIDYMKNLYQVYNLNILDAAVIPEKPISPLPSRDIPLGGVLGLIIGIILAILREQLRIPLEAFRQRRLLDSQSSAFNREHFESLLGLQTETSQLAGSIYSLVMIKLPGLGVYYDTLPQPVLNRLLHDVVGILKAGLRGNDVVGRWDDFTFALLLPDTPSIAAQTIRGRFFNALTPPMPLASLDETILLKPQIGSSSFESGMTADDITLKTLRSMDE
jgi:capsular polysaccharide biosynthesis protein